MSSAPQSAHPSASSGAPVFVLSCARSGSTLTRFVLDTHPAICAPPELHLLEACQKLLWVHGVLDDEAAEGERWTRAIPLTRRTMDEIMGGLCRRKGKPVWCEKSVGSVNHLDMLDGIFPDARRIYLYRQALDVVASGLAATRNSPEGFDFETYLARWGHHRGEALLRYWLDKTETLMAHEAAHGGLRLRYEDLVRATEESLDRIAGYLELERPGDWQDQIFQTPHAAGPGDASIWSRDRIDDASIGRGDGVELAGVSRNLIRKVNRCLAQLDYPELP